MTTGLENYDDWSSYEEEAMGMPVRHPVVPALARANGATVRVQLAADRHRDQLAEFLTALSPATAFLRFFGADPRPTKRMLDLFVSSDADHRATIATHDGRVIGHAMLARTPNERAGRQPCELAVVVSDEWQRQGLGPQLVRHLLSHAGGLADDGVSFTILADNLHANSVAQRMWPLATMAADRDVVSYRVDAGQPHASSAANHTARVA